MKLSIGYILNKSYLFDKACSIFKFAIINSSLKKSLSAYLKAYISKEDLEYWFDKNQTLLSQYSDSINWQNHYDKITGYEPVKGEYIFLSAQDLSNVSAFQRMELVKESILLSYGAIPRLFLFHAKNQSVSYSSLDIDLSHNFFLVKMFKELLNVSHTRDYDKDKIVSFIKDNKKNIDKIRGLFDGQPKYLGSGIDGVAFKINNSQVLKIFRSEKSYSDASKAMDTLYTNPSFAKTEAMIYDAGILGIHDGRPLYYYIIELMKSVNDFPEDFKYNLRIVIKYIVFEINDNINSLRKLKYSNKIVDLTKINEAKAEISDFVNKIILNIKYNDNEDLMSSIQKVGHHAGLKPDWLKLLAEEIVMKYITGRTDLHVGNIGVTGYGELRYFDPSYEGHDSAINA